ncbi:DUF4363 family protein [Sediminibacillus dalangtanensis]|uniref:DUF4363 family protein n=1 Tax=Sediminibacillus dalangtanensis TaxID=2729421 RepID=A0ABX7VPK1_9BACI|nr:DUF4363 family protein [Sediminibacillus dalangtanensis]QTM98774.1 DUF4363 family protein [Sediminibacillus dalangtanensis]
MKKFLLYFIPLLTLSVFIAVMNSGAFLKQPLGKDDRLYESIQLIEAGVKNKDWSKVKTETAKMEKAWDKIARRIQFSVEKEQLLEIDGTIARIRGAVEAEDDQSVLEEIYYYYGQWEQLAR